jgi:hypothetical protein
VSGFPSLATWAKASYLGQGWSTKASYLSQGWSIGNRGQRRRRRSGGAGNIEDLRYSFASFGAGCGLGCQSSESSGRTSRQ